MPRRVHGRLCLILLTWVMLAFAGASFPPAPAFAEAVQPPSRADLLKSVLTNPQILVHRDADGRFTVAHSRIPLPVTFAELPVSLREALIATEDQRFGSWEHALGFDPVGMIRAVFGDLFRHRLAGGSGLNQQLDKNTVVGPAQSFGRKWVELLDSMKIEELFTKEEILTIYFNNMYFGSVEGRDIIGIEQAARFYYGITTPNLSLYESAVLVGMLQGPAKLNPLSHPAESRARATHVLQRMVDASFISAADMAAALAEIPKRGRWRPVELGAAFYTSWVTRQLPQLIPAETPDDLRVVLALDPALQARAQEAVRAMVKRGEQFGTTQGALVSMTPDGAVRAIVGAVDFKTSRFDHATMAERQPGSAMKPFVYLQALEEGWTPRSRVLDAPILPGWPRNAEGRYEGMVTLQEALQRSLNAASVRLAQRLGPDKIVALAHGMGIHSDLKANETLALGSSEVTLLELTSGYATIAAHGRLAIPRGIVAVLTADGQPVALLPPAVPEPTQPVDAKYADQLAEMLRGVITSGTGRAARIPSWSAGKTGTTQDNRDAWFVGWASANQLVTGVWTGNDDATPMRGVAGGTLPAAAWRRLYLADLNARAANQSPRDQEGRGTHVVAAR